MRYDNTGYIDEKITIGLVLLLESSEHRTKHAKIGICPFVEYIFVSCTFLGQITLHSNGPSLVHHGINITSTGVVAKIKQSVSH